MTQSPRPPIPNLVPENAPFTAEQRAWLNGFFAGFLELDGITALSPEANAALMSRLVPAAKIPLDDGDDGEAPWHDPALVLAERMKLAEGRPLRRRMMAAMGQQDCGQCGYNCQDYSEAVFSGAEKRLNLCVPGGKDTARTLKALHQELGSALEPASVEIPATTPIADVTAAPAGAPAASRDNPAKAIFLSRTRLNKPSSEKETWH